MSTGDFSFDFQGSSGVQSKKPLSAQAPRTEQRALHQLLHSDPLNSEDPHRRIHLYDRMLGGRAFFFSKPQKFILNPSEDTHVSKDTKCVRPTYSHLVLRRSYENKNVSGLKYQTAEVSMTCWSEQIQILSYSWEKGFRGLNKLYGRFEAEIRPEIQNPQTQVVRAPYIVNAVLPVMLVCH